MSTDRHRDLEERPSFSVRQKWRIGVHVVVSTVALFAIAVMLNYLAHRHNERIYLSRMALQELSPLTRQMLATLTNKVKIIVFFDRREPLFGPVSALAKEYEARSPNVEVEFVDYRMPGRAEAIRAQYKLAMGSDASRIIFDSGGQVRTVLGTELSEFDLNNEQREIRRVGFKGEQLFTSAILNITQTEPVTAYYLQGHGEHDPASTDDQRGYSRFTTLMENNNVIVKTVGPLVSTGVPEDCGLLIIAGPLRPFDPREVEAIEKYLNEGGRLFLLYNINAVSTPTGLEEMLWNWNVEVGFNWVQDEELAQAGASGEILTGNFGPHPLVRPLLRSSLKLIAPRTVGQRKAAPTTPNPAKVVEIVSTGPNGQAIVPRGGNEWEVQRRGVIPLIVAVERGGVQGVTSEGSARLVVSGDSFFLSNLAFNQAANSDFGAVALSWLVNRDSLLNEIGPSPVSEYQILLTESEMRMLRWLFLGAIPGGVLLLGGIVWMRRRA